jgi:hypothetical protein
MPNIKLNSLWVHVTEALLYRILLEMDDSPQIIYYVLYLKYAVTVATIVIDVISPEITKGRRLIPTQCTRCVR